MAWSTCGTGWIPIARSSRPREGARLRGRRLDYLPVRLRSCRAGYLEDELAPHVAALALCKGPRCVAKVEGANLRQDDAAVTHPCCEVLQTLARRLRHDEHALDS